MRGRDFFFSAGIVVTVLFHFLTTTQITLQHQSSRHRHTSEDTTSEATLAARLDYIDSLPGLRYDPGFNQFSGYLDVSSTRHLFYWLVESQGDPATDPLIFWTNGGPGCSGMIGLGQEHGPFIINEKGDLSENPYSWNKFANVLYIEQPAGVGFSYGDSDADLVTGDHQAARDNYRFLQQFFERFPKKKSNPFYISSESYGGHYIPQLANEILKNNKHEDINFQGFLVGNPFVDIISNMKSGMETSYYHGLLSKPRFDRWIAVCADTDPRNMTEACATIFIEIANASGHDNTDPYALDYPLCAEEVAIGTQKKPKLRSLQSSSLDMKENLLWQGSLGAHSLSVQGAVLMHQTASSPPFLPRQDVYRPCSGLHMTNYFLRPDVREALHVRNESTTEWAMCRPLNYSIDDVLTSTIPLFRELVLKGAQGHHGLNMLVFSGDDDSVCATSGTQEWIWSLGVNVTEDQYWKSWKVGGQTAGFYTKFDLGEKTNSSFSFATVRGAGHEVPATRPMEALELLRLFLSGKTW